MIVTSGSDAVGVTSAAVLPKLPVTVDTQGRVRTTQEQRLFIPTTREPLASACFFCSQADCSFPSPRLRASARAKLELVVPLLALLRLPVNAPPLPLRFPLPEPPWPVSAALATRPVPTVGCSA